MDSDAQTPDSPLTEEDVLEVLRNVEDPELGMDIVELGLIYSVEFPEPGMVRVHYTFTTPACPVGPQITGDIVAHVQSMPGVYGVEPVLEFSPAWTPDRMSDDAKFILGIG